ncbi:MAG: ferric-dicitrate binding protein FerR (iron transport regulator) [Halioglobus sp.]|jgi:ferric-dicitrate binding protein FerR (iron transport regulator)
MTPISIKELELLESWLENQDFLSWANGLTDASAERWQAFLKDNPQHAELCELAKYAHNNLNVQEPAIDQAKSQLALNDLYAKIDQRKLDQMNADQKKSKSKVKTFFLNKPWRVAASVIMLLGFGFLSQNALNNSVVVYTSLDERREIKLDDGTEVVLNTNTTLSHVKDQPRIITLDGEAYFQVAKKVETKEQFQVKTNDLVVTVLGTEFNVNSRDNQTSVFLDEGKVVLDVIKKDNEIVELEPGDLVSYSQSENKIVKKKNENSIMNTAWKDDVVYFKDAHIADVLPVISRLYDVQFEQSNLELVQKQFSGGMPVRDINITLATLSQVYGIEINGSDKFYSITNKKE